MGYSNFRETFPEIEIVHFQQFTKNLESAVLKAANIILVNIEGVAVLNFGLSSLDLKFNLPFIVTQEELQNPIIRYNIIQYLVNQVESPNLNQTLEH